MKFISYIHWLNESRTIKVDNVDLPIVVISKENWAEGKTDPTEFDADNSVVRVRSDYDYNKDPLNWMKHKLIHYLYYKNKIEDDGKDYPANSTEDAAYTYQFKAFKKEGIEKLEDIVNKLGKSHYFKILKKYWDKA